MTKDNANTSFFDSINDAFEYFIEEVYPEIPPHIKRERHLSQLKGNHKNGSVSEKRKKRILEEFTSLKIALTKKNNK